MRFFDKDIGSLNINTYEKVYFNSRTDFESKLSVWDFMIVRELYVFK